MDEINESMINKKNNIEKLKENLATSILVAMKWMMKKQVLTRVG